MSRHETEISAEGVAAMCEGKDAFDSAILANSVAKRRRYACDVYRCPACHRWHIGSPLKRKSMKANPVPRARPRNRNGVRMAQRGQ